MTKWQVDSSTVKNLTAVKNGAVDLYAVWAENTYTVTWTDWNGTVLETDENVPYGTVPTYDGEEPRRRGDNSYTYTFERWLPLVSEVTGDVTYTASYTATPIK